MCYSTSSASCHGFGCLVIQLSYSLFGDGLRLLDGWSGLSKSPTLQEFFWSPLVESAFDVNRKVFSSTPTRIPSLGSVPLDKYSHDAPLSALRYAPIQGLLALHIRRGDFKSIVPGSRSGGLHTSASTLFPSFPITSPIPQIARRSNA